MPTIRLPLARCFSIVAGRCSAWRWTPPRAYRDAREAWRGLGRSCARLAENQSASGTAWPRSSVLQPITPKDQKLCELWDVRARASRAPRISVQSLKDPRFSEGRDSPVHDIVAIAEVILIDIALAADNAIVVGLAASRIPPQIRRQAIVWGISGAVVLRLLFAGLVSELFSIIGLTLAGGLLLLWVCWKMFRELRGPAHENGFSPSASSAALWRAVARMVVADVSMSLDNVLAIAGAARGSLMVLAVGLIVSVSLMATASTLLAKLLGRLPWIAWLGLLIVVCVAFDMIWRGIYEITSPTQTYPTISSGVKN
jgi:YjbE family integral membrane protein